MWDDLDRLKDKPVISIAAGITVGLVASVVQSLGLTIQRKSHVLNQALSESQQVVEHRRPLWLLGFAIFISSNILGSVVQVASLPVVILAPLGAVSLLWNAFFARFILGDEFSVWLVIGTFLIAGGAVLIAVFGIVPEPTHSLDDLLALFSRPEFITYFSILGALVLLALIATHVADWTLGKRLSAPSPLDTPPLEEEVLTASEQTPLLHRGSKSRGPPQQLSHEAIKRARVIIAISYASASGIISGMCLLFAKSGVELLLLTLKGNNQFTKWQSWMLLLGLGVFALLQLWYLHKSLILADPTLVCPLAFCFYNVSSIANSLVYYDQFALLSPLHLGLVALGTVVLLAGVWSVSIQAGDRKGVDIGTFHEGEVLAEMSIADLEESRPVGELTQSQSLPTRLPSTIGRHHPHRRSVTAPSQMRNIQEEVDGAPQPPDVVIEPPTPLGTLEESHEPQGGPSLSPRGKRFFSFLSPSASSETSSNPLAGFSIGLSPLSPGFALVPKRTIRMSIPGVRGLRMRRALSESDIQPLGENQNANTRQSMPNVGTSDQARQTAKGKGKAKVSSGKRSKWKWPFSFARRDES